jgi:hypothetical protein
VIVGTDRQEVLNRIQSAFAREFEYYGNLKESDIRPMDYKTKLAWSRIRKHIKKTNQVLSPGLRCSLKTVILKLLENSTTAAKNLIPKEQKTMYFILFYTQL